MSQIGKKIPEFKTMGYAPSKEEFVEVSWDVALGLTTKAILDTIEKHGNEANAVHLARTCMNG